MQNCESPTGRFLIGISAWEARMSLWIESPTLSERDSGELLLAFTDQNWSLDSADWLDEAVVVLNLRKYPGNHRPPQVIAKIDCAARTAEVDGRRIDSLAQLEHVLDESLEWIYAAPLPPQRGGGLLGIIRRLFGA
jgi:hypothetical protein